MVTKECLLWPNVIHANQGPRLPRAHLLYTATGLDSLCLVNTTWGHRCIQHCQHSWGIALFLKEGGGGVHFFNCFKPGHGKIGMLKEWDIHLYGAPAGIQTQVLWILLSHWNPGQRNGGQASGESILSNFHTTTRTASGRHKWVVPILKPSKVTLEV